VRLMAQTPTHAAAAAAGASDEPPGPEGLRLIP
jgi:hypothetical protein